MNLSEENLLIDTPENITFGYEIAGIGSRFLAALVDTTLIVLLQILVNFLMILVVSSIMNLEDVFSASDPFGSSVSWVIALIGLIAFFFFWGYYIFFELLTNGRSPGKSLVKLRVIRVDGTPITLSETIVRNLVRLVDFMPLAYGVGVITMFINPQSRRLGDLAAGTLVVREHAEKITLKSLGAQQIAPLEVVPGSQPAGAPAQDYPIQHLTGQDIQMIESFLSRRQALQNRRTLAMQLARTTLGRMHLPDSEIQPGEAEQILEAVLHAYRASRNVGK
jgi:uncharacterized RDD family membrane protein YckC